MPRHLKKGGNGHNSQKWGLGHGHNHKKGGSKGGLRHENESKKGVLRTGLVKKTISVTDVAQKGVLGAYLLITLPFSCKHDKLVGVYSDRLKIGVLGTRQARKGVFGTFR